MLADSDPKPRTGVRNYLIISWALVAIVALLYVGWFFLSRRQENRDAVQRAADQKRAEDQRSVEFLGGDRFDILSFYASPGIIRRGDSAKLCYGVSNAKSVRLDPPAGEVWPSYSRCLTVSPQKTTSYTLTAQDSAGNLKTSTLRLEVR
ncbi:MAG TPA: hypothetical protein VG033_09190 [Candidatus Acidoferrales bacterium]|jgi:hypothetical protein|nr:hypothetical protein [Candidatus Acidoferrales bacterium]